MKQLSWVIDKRNGPWICLHPLAYSQRRLSSWWCRSISSLSSVATHLGDTGLQRRRQCCSLLWSPSSMCFCLDSWRRMTVLVALALLRVSLPPLSIAVWSSLIGPCWHPSLPSFSWHRQIGHQARARAPLAPRLSWWFISSARSSVRPSVAAPFGSPCEPSATIACRFPACFSQQCPCSLHTNSGRQCSGNCHGGLALRRQELQSCCFLRFLGW